MTTPETAASRLPEGAHASRFVRIPLSDFNQPGVPDCWVELRNVGLMSADQIEALTAGIDGIQVGEDGVPGEDAVPALYRQLLRLIRSWSMWDASSDEDTPPLLPSPPTSVEELKKAPGLALKALGDALGELQNPH